jgi:hypothetical protein
MRRYFCRVFSSDGPFAAECVGDRRPSIAAWVVSSAFGIRYERWQLSRDVNSCFGRIWRTRIDLELASRIDCIDEEVIQMSGLTENYCPAIGRRAGSRSHVSFAHFLALCCMAALLAPAASRAGGNSDPGFADARVLAGEWWNWALAGPPDENPIVDPDGRNCALRQHGKIWFLAGSFGETITRFCSIPPGKALFIPLFNSLWWADAVTPTIEEVRAAANADVGDSSVDVQLTVDGVPLADPFAYRAQSPPGGFRFVSLPGSMADVGFGLAPGAYDPAVSDGYWVLVNRLTPGHHTIRIEATAFGGGFNVDVTYELEIGPL